MMELFKDILMISGARLRQHAVRAHLRVDRGPVPVPRLRQGLQGGERVGLGAHARPAEDPAQPESAGKETGREQRECEMRANSRTGCPVRSETTFRRL